MHEHREKPVERSVLNLLCTLVTVPTYVSLRLFTRFAPEYPDGPRSAEHDPPPPVPCTHDAAARVLELFLAAYQRSAVHTHLHRNGPLCHFIPSCSEYPVRAVRKYGLWRGLRMAGARFRRCNGAYEGDYVDFP